MPEGPEGPYDPRAAARALASDRLNATGRKLTLYDQCAAFYALYNGVASHIVAKAFGISRTAASQLGGCLQTDPRPYTIELRPDDQGHMHETRIHHRDMNCHRMADRKQRYRRVAELFNEMGEQAFADKYFPETIRDRIRAAKAGDVPRKRQGSDPRANEGPDETTLPHGHVSRVAFLPEGENQPAGWYVLGEYMPSGREKLEGGDLRPFKNKQAALKGAWLMNGYDPPKYIV